MPGFNQTALAFSLERLPGQIQAIYDTLPYIVQIHVTDASSGDPQAVDLYQDYIKGIDGHAYDMNGKDYTVSFKSRFPSKWPLDLRLEAIRLTDEASRNNNKAGFMYNGERYAFEGFGDINVQWINDRNYIFLGSELQALALQYGSDNNDLVNAVEEKYSYDRYGNSFFSGRYYVFLDRELFCKYINWLCQQRTEYQSEALENNA